jgi:hypothetical protein
LEVGWCGEGGGLGLTCTVRASACVSLRAQVLEEGRIIMRQGEHGERHRDSSLTTGSPALALAPRTQPDAPRRPCLHKPPPAARAVVLAAHALSNAASGVPPPAGQYLLYIVSGTVDILVKWAQPQRRAGNGASGPLAKQGGGGDRDEMMDDSDSMSPIVDEDSRQHRVNLMRASQKAGEFVRSLQNNAGARRGGGAGVRGRVRDHVGRSCGGLGRQGATATPKRPAGSACRRAWPCRLS